MSNPQSFAESLSNREQELFMQRILRYAGVEVSVGQLNYLVLELVKREMEIKKEKQ